MVSKMRKGPAGRHSVAVKHLNEGRHQIYGESGVPVITRGSN